jgi:hypothetical protein
VWGNLLGTEVLMEGLMVSLDATQKARRDHRGGFRGGGLLTALTTLLSSTFCTYKRWSVISWVKIANMQDSGRQLALLKFYLHSDAGCR